MNSLHSENPTRKYNWSIQGSDASLIDSNQSNHINVQINQDARSDSTVTVASGNLRDSLKLVVTQPLSVYPTHSVILPDSSIQIQARGGSGTFKFQTNDTLIGSIENQSGDQITVHALEQGQVTIHVIDSITNELVKSIIRISDVSKVYIQGDQFVQIGNSILLNVSATTDRNDQISHDAIKGAQITTRDFEMISIDPIGNSFKITGNKPGVISVTPSALDAKSKRIIGTSHSIQIYEPLRASPEQLLLVQGASRQVHVMGGPKSRSTIYQFASGDSQIASVDQEGLVTAHSIGHTDLIVSCQLPNSNQLLASVKIQIHVVKITGIKSSHPSVTLNTNESLPIHIYATSTHGQLSPMSLQSNRIRIHYNVDDSDLISTSTTNQLNCTSIHVYSKHVTGITQINIKLQMSDFESFETIVMISVVEPIYYTKNCKKSTLVAMSNSWFHLSTNYDSSHSNVKFSIAQSDQYQPAIESVSSSSGLIRTSSSSSSNTERVTVVLAQELLNSQITGTQIILKSIDTLSPFDSKHQQAIQVGAGATINVPFVAKDLLGNAFVSTNGMELPSISFSKIHICDAKVIKSASFDPSDLNLEISGKNVGSVLLEIKTNASKHAYYLMVQVSSAIEPSHISSSSNQANQLLIGDVVNFKLDSQHVVRDGKWSTDQPSVMTIDSQSGKAICKQSGNVEVNYRGDDSNHKMSLFINQINNAKLSPKHSVLGKGDHQVPVVLYDARGRKVELESNDALISRNSKIKCLLSLGGNSFNSKVSNDVGSVTVLKNDVANKNNCLLRVQPRGDGGRMDVDVAVQIENDSASGIPPVTIRPSSGVISIDTSKNIGTFGGEKSRGGSSTKGGDGGGDDENVKMLPIMLFATVMATLLGYVIKNLMSGESSVSNVRMAHVSGPSHVIDHTNQDDRHYLAHDNFHHSQDSVFRNAKLVRREQQSSLRYQK
ncbi:hypothetical protein AKO1_013568 [Acrasis kona]|uniref:BIG2 domain-containing protein n=1 Tax=Acrasis kona TaxID=1008807 RepID=A0AAW2ZJU1_9EUKA